MMGIRAICFVIAVVLFLNHFGWLTAIPAIGAIFIPYFAVVFANGGREPDNTRGFMEYQPNAARHPRLQQAPRSKRGKRSPPRRAGLRAITNLTGDWACSGLVPRSGCNWVLTQWGVFPCTIHIDALVPRRSITAGVPGPRRNADDRDAGWFAPVATRRRPYSAAFQAASRGSQCSPGDDPRTPRGAAPWVRLAVGPVPSAESGSSGWLLVAGSGVPAVGAAGALLRVRHSCDIVPGLPAWGMSGKAGGFDGGDRGNP